MSSLIETARVFFVIDEESAAALKQHYPGLRVEVARDTRIENVLERKRAWTGKVANSEFTMVWGSIYPYEMKMIAEVIKKGPEIAHILVPHRVDSKTLEHIRKLLPSEFSIFEEEKSTPGRITLVTSVGHLSGLYARADIAYVGGGFKGRLHNVYEALVYELPVLVGPDVWTEPGVAGLIRQNFLVIIEDADRIIEEIHKHTESIPRERNPDFDRLFSMTQTGSARIYKEVSAVING